MLLLLLLLRVIKLLLRGRVGVKKMRKCRIDHDVSMLIILKQLADTLFFPVALAVLCVPCRVCRVFRATERLSRRVLSLAQLSAGPWKQPQKRPVECVPGRGKRAVSIGSAQRAEP